MNYQNKIGKGFQKCVLVFSGFNQRAVIAFIRTLKKNNLNYAIIAKSEADTIFLTEYARDVLALRKSVPLDLIDILETIKVVQRKCNADEYVIAPTSEALNRFLLKYKNYFNDLKCIIPLVNRELYETISNKYSFGAICSKSGIRTPKELKFDVINVFPVVAKPKRYFSVAGVKELAPRIITNSQELASFSEEQNLDDYYFQEYIFGKSLYLLYYFSKHGTIYKFSQENMIQQPDGKSMVASISSDFHKTIESEKYERMFTALNYHGLVMVEIKQSDGINYMIEANPRFWGPSQLFVDAGVNFFEPLLYDYHILNKLPRYCEPNEIVRYFWFGGIIEVYKRNKSLNYYQSDEMELICSLPTWLQSDVYRRPDTAGIFKREVFE